MLNFIKNISPTEIGLIVVILIFFFGARTIKSLGKVSGQTVKEIKNIKNEFIKAVEAEPDDESAKKERKGVST